MFKKLIEAFKIKEVRIKIILTLVLWLVFRFGSMLPIPLIDKSVFAGATSGSNSFLGLLNSISGGALSNGAFLALGVTPYINASIIMQLLAVAIPSLERLGKQGEEGRKKINMYTRICALVLAVAQAVGIVVAYSNSIRPDYLWEGAPLWLAASVVVVILIAGGMFTVWLGERITDLGIGNGLSLLIFVGILSSAGSSLIATISQITNDVSVIWDLVIFGLIVFVDMSERKVPVQYAKQIKGRKMYGGQNTHIPIRVNAGGVMPIIFASALLTFPQLIISIFWPNSNAMAWYNEWL